jgi:hypothetical protein
MKLKLHFIVVVVVSLSLSIKAQSSDSRYSVQTIFDNNLVTYEGNRGALRLDINSGDLIFISNLANFQTGHKTTDSLLSEQHVMLLTFNANIGQNIFELIDRQNDDRYHMTTGTITVNNVSYNMEGFFRLKNLGEESNLSKVLVDLKLEIDPKIVKLPYLSDYFKNTLVFYIEDSYSNQNK